MNILDRIVEQKRVEVAQRKAIVPAQELTQRSAFDRPVNSARAALQTLGSSGIIAEFKRKSPSKGIINGVADVVETTYGYVKAGAACLSVLTDEPFFGGTPADLMAARTANPTTPILRKDFVIDSYQLLEAKAWGADLVLLIAACLTPREIAELSQQATELGMEVLLEVHDEDELEQALAISSLADTVDLIGVNNRSLKTFVTSVETSLRLAEHIPGEFVRVAESGLSTATTIQVLREAGFEGFLIGEAFMKTSSPAAALAELVADAVGQISSINHTTR